MDFLTLCKRFIMRGGKSVTVVCSEGHSSTVYYSIGGKKLCLYCFQAKFAKLMLSLGVKEVIEKRLVK